MKQAQILQRANAMIDVRWTAPSTFLVKTETGQHEFRAGRQYVGMPYHWWGNDDLDSFQRKLAARPVGAADIGNDCSSFVGHAWGLPERMTTATFAADAVGAQRYCHALGAPGECEGSGLLPGDACNLGGWHIVLVGEIVAGGVMSLEQTAGPRLRADEMRRFWSWKWLADNRYTPLRRNGVEDGRPTATLRWRLPPGATWSRLWIRRNGHEEWLDTWISGATEWRGAVPNGRYQWWVLPWSRGAGEGAWLAGPGWETGIAEPGFEVVVETTGGDA